MLTLKCNVPQVRDHAEALRLYREQTEIGTGDIAAIFGVSPSTARRLKSVVRERMAEDKTPSYNANLVNVETAYKTWGLDVRKLERAVKLRMTEAGG